MSDYHRVPSVQERLCILKSREEKSSSCHPQTNVSKFFHTKTDLIRWLDRKENTSMDTMRHIENNFPSECNFMYRNLHGVVRIVIHSVIVQFDNHPHLMTYWQYEKWKSPRATARNIFFSKYGQTGWLSAHRFEPVDTRINPTTVVRLKIILVIYHSRASLDRAARIIGRFLRGSIPKQSDAPSRRCAAITVAGKRLEPCSVKLDDAVVMVSQTSTQFNERSAEHFFDGIVGAGAPERDVWISRIWKEFCS